MDILLYLTIFISLVLVLIIRAYNSLIKLRNDVKKTFASVDVQLKRKIDLIPNLVKMVKGYIKHEKELLTSLTEARTSIMKASAQQDLSAMAKGENSLKETLKSILAVSENYPDLKANQNFLELQEALEETEDQIAAARRIYNESVNVYNTKTEVFPTVIIASLFRFSKKDFFELSERGKENLSIDI
ncbi:MAG: LemA family protein [Flavobacteriaceae bacterium]